MTANGLMTIDPTPAAPLAEASTFTPAMAMAMTATTLDGLDSEHSRRNYKRALLDFWRWYGERPAPICRATLQRYRAEMIAGGVKAGNVNFRLAAIRRMLREAADNGVISETAVRSAVTVESVKTEGQSTGRRLTRRQAESFINSLPAETMSDLRDRALIALLLLSGLRRGEVAALDVEHLEMVDARWTLRNIVGKRGKMRTVAIPSIVKTMVDAWLTAAHISAGRVFRPINRGGNLSGDSMSAEAIRQIVERARQKANQAGADIPEIATHDLRRTYARLAREAGAPLEQIQFSLGHASIKTTERYTSMEQNFHSAPCDVIGLSIQTEATR
jgi:site-specific recombinase XerD